MTAFFIFQVPVAAAGNLEGIFVCPFLQATIGAALVAVLGGLYVDILEPIEIGAHFIQACVGLLGPQLRKSIGLRR